MRVLQRTDGIFRAIHDEVMAIEVDLTGFDRSRFPEPLLRRAQQVWQERVQTEFRSVQMMTRFLHDAMAAGDPLEVYSAAADLIQDEIRHVALCAEMTRALGAEPVLPEPLEVEQPAQFLALPAAGRALATAIAMLAVNETLSLGFILDLHGRCENPFVKSVLEATVADEEGHQGLGWEYIERSLERFPASSLPSWQRVAEQALAPQRRQMEAILRDVPPNKRTLDAWPEPELVDLGLFSPQRQALVLQQALQSDLEPKLSRAGLT